MERLSKKYFIIPQILFFHGDVQFLSELCLALVLNNFQQPCISQGFMYWL